MEILKEKTTVGNKHKLNIANNLELKVNTYCNAFAQIWNAIIT